MRWMAFIDQMNNPTSRVCRSKVTRGNKLPQTHLFYYKTGVSGDQFDHCPGYVVFRSDYHDERNVLKHLFFPSLNVQRDWDLMSTLSVNVADRIATITFNRPKSYNAITLEGTLNPDWSGTSSPFHTRLRRFCECSSGYRQERWCFGDSLARYMLLQSRSTTVTRLKNVTLATGKWFCAYVIPFDLNFRENVFSALVSSGTDVKGRTGGEPTQSLRPNFLRNVTHTTLDCGQAVSALT